jgi:hypothetical protein
MFFLKADKKDIENMNVIKADKAEINNILDFFILGYISTLLSL